MHFGSKITENRLLAALPVADLERLSRLTEAVDMPLGEVLYDSGRRPTHAYFPTTSIVSLLYARDDRRRAEIAVVGREGVVGISLFLGDEPIVSQGIVQCAGQGFRVSAAHLMQEFNRAGPLMELLLRHAMALVAQKAQTVECNLHHSLDERLCRWLLLSLDRRPDGDLVMTEELIGNVLGANREGVTDALLDLQTAGMIAYARGRITVIDRRGLGERACECYSVVKNEYDQLLPDTGATGGGAPRSRTEKFDPEPTLPI